MKRNLPGPFTFILPGTTRLPKIFRGRKQKEVGIRMPDHPITSQLVKMLGGPVMSEKVCKIILVLSLMLGFPKHEGNW